MKTSVQNLSLVLALPLAFILISATAQADTFYVSNIGSQKVVKFTADGTGSDFASVGNPYGLTFDNAGNLYVADPYYGGNNTADMILKFTTNGVSSTFFTIGSSTPHSSPEGMAFDSSGNLYVSYYGYSYVEKFSPTGTDLGRFGNTNTASYPASLAFDQAGNLYVGNNSHDAIQRFTPDGRLSTFISAASLYSSSPVGLAFDQEGNLYVSLQPANIIEKYSTNGTDLGAFASTNLNVPFGLAFDSAGNLYVANNGNNKIIKFTPAGVGSDFAVNNLSSPNYIAIARDQLILTNLIVSPASGSIYVTSNQQFTATGYFSDGSVQTVTSNLLWSSSSPNVAAITTNGFATGLTNGVTTITAISGGVSNSTTLTVFAVLTNIYVTPANATIAISSNQQFAATGLYNDGSSLSLTGTASWSSSSPTVVTINTGGLATGGTNGTIMITATSGSVSGSATLTVVAPPAITIQSTNGTIANGNVILNVGATGGGLSYQWQFNGTNISGATGASLTLTNYSTNNIGVYTVVISNAAGSVTSQPIVIATVGIKMFAGVIINGPIGSNYLIQASGNLASTNWTTLTNVALPTQPYIYIDYNSPGNNQQFYRAVPNWTNSLPSGIGVNWTPRDTNRNWQCVASSADGTKLVAGAYNDKLYTSTDSGVTWIPRISQNWLSVASSADGTKLFAVVQNGPFYTSTDSGVTWTQRGGTPFWSVASSADGTKLVAIPYTTGPIIYTSTDSGVSWTEQYIGGNQNWWSVASSADGTKLVIVVGGGQILTSTNSGVSWTSRDSSRNWHSVASSSDGTKLVAVVYGGQIYTSTDSGVNWIPQNSSNQNWVSVASSSDGTKLVAVVINGQIYTSIDSGVTWTARASSQNWYSVASSADGTKLVAVVYGGQIYTSTP